MDSVLKQYFGYSHFRPYQKEIIEKILDGRDCLVVMATGSGKSICYQVPPLVRGKTAIVVSPLLSLMQDQVMSLKQRGVKAEYLGSTQTGKTVYSEAESGTFDVLYITPERASSLPPRFWAKLLSAGICLLAVDEAHCISEWGHDFRKEYKQLHMLREVLPNVPFVGLTATATDKVRNDIVRSLKMGEPYIAIGSFDRPNIFYGVRSFNRSLSFTDELIAEISKYSANSGSTIIYCTTVKDTEQIFESLRDAGIKAGIYHGQMGGKARESSHRSFIRDELQVMVATIAFGMGIDKPNIRCVIHYGCPKSLESYYQESGRCGRDGLPSICWLYYSRSDFAKADFYCAEAHTENRRKAIMESLMAAEKYCLLPTCRRKSLLQYFGEVSPSDCGNCDNCVGPKRERDLSRESFLLLSCIHSCGGRWGLNLPIDVLRGSRSRKVLDCNFDKLQSHGLGKDYSANWWKAFAGLLITYGYLKEKLSDTYRTVSVSPSGKQFLHAANTVDQEPLVLTLNNQMIEEEEHGVLLSKVGDIKSLTAQVCEGFSEAEAKLYRELLDMRMKLANGIGTAPYAICGDQTIKKIAKIRPSTKARLANIDGVNQNLMDKFGDCFLQSISQLSQGLDLPLDGEVTIQTAITKKVYQNSQSAQKKLTPAKYEAWKMWQGSGLSFQEIANYRRKSAPIKEQTVIAYILEAAREGCEINWTRYCVELGLSPQMAQQIHNAIKKIGSRDRLKPIKEELPENVTYDQIKAFLTMEELGALPVDFADSASSSSGHNPATISESVTHSLSIEAEQKSIEVQSFIKDKLEPDFSESTGCPATTPLKNCNSVIIEQKKQLRRDDTQFHEGSAKKLHLDDEQEKCCDELEATKNSILEWILDHDGASLIDILQHFKGSNTDSVVELLGSLEGEFLIFKKNDLYRVL